MIKAADRAAFMAALAAAHPDPKSELNWTTPFELLVAVVLSAQATDKGVNLATAKLFPLRTRPRQLRRSASRASRPTFRRSAFTETRPKTS